MVGNVKREIVNPPTEGIRIALDLTGGIDLSDERSNRVLDDTSICHLDKTAALALGIGDDAARIDGAHRLHVEGEDIEAIASLTHHTQGIKLRIYDGAVGGNVGAR